MRQNLTFYLKQEGEEQKSFDKELMEMFQDLSSDDQESSADEVNLPTSSPFIFPIIGLRTIQMFNLERATETNNLPETPY